MLIRKLLRIWYKPILINVLDNVMLSSLDESLIIMNFYESRCVTFSDENIIFTLKGVGNQ